MKMLAEFRDSDFFPGTKNKIGHKIRPAVRMVIFDEKNNIAILYSDTRNYLQIPGGGIHKGESVEKAIRREALEETGCEIVITKEIGDTKLYMDRLNLLSHSHCFIARVTKHVKEPELNQDERKRGLKLVWLPIDEAIEKMEKEPIVDYFGAFVRAVTLKTLKEVKKIMKK